MKKVVATIALAAFSGVSYGQLIDVTPTTVVPGFGTSWYSIGNSGGGSSSITAFTGIDGDGAAELRGDRTRLAIGNIFPSNTSPLPAVGLLSNVTSFSYRWTVTSLGSGVVTAQAPALRLHVLDPLNNRRIEFVFEDGEQSSPQFVAGAGSLGTVYSGDFFSGRVYAFTGGSGRGLYTAGGALIPGSDSAQTLASLISTLNVSNATVTGVSLGVGSSVGGEFIGYADAVTLRFGTDPELQMNFIPTPGAMGLLGLAGIAAISRRRR